MRIRIAAVYGLVFSLLGAALLSLVYFLSRADAVAKAQELMGRTLQTVPEQNPPPTSAEQEPGTVTLELAQFASRQVLIWSGAALLVMSVLAVGIGWWIAGRVLRPVHAMTATARRISQQNLDERIALGGPKDELKELADTFDELLARLESSFDSQRRFIANASHELRTPLAAQRAALQIGLENPSPEDVVRVRERLLDANRRSQHLIDGLLLLANSERGIKETALVDLSEVAAEEAGSCAPAAKAAQVTLTVDKGHAPVRANRVLLSQLIANLLRNAIAYNQPHGHVVVRIAPGRLTVTNTGPAVAPQDIPALFEPFRRGRGKDRMTTVSATNVGGGHGLGLALVRSIATAHGGTVTACPGPEGGLCIEVRLPAER
uniref:sensor histidine kinase n=1 Tax=Streptomyces polyasparticus TaxID=2767826 RepID=UPI001BE42757|nr:HAMP domain-containing sensor histidine kinase [Streptomyces polyasparticus]